MEARRLQNYALALTGEERAEFERLVCAHGWIRVEVLTRAVRHFLSITDAKRMCMMTSHAEPWSPPTDNKCES